MSEPNDILQAIEHGEVLARTGVENFQGWPGEGSEGSATV
ncbi:MAG: hypothetical protein JWR19_3648 [Pedosphaera sp.]|nr:hypothetical protein [Pedosphaera sp.]